MANIPLAGAPLSAGDLAAIFPQDVDAWTSYVPTLTQPGAVSKTVTSARYMKVGRWVAAQVYLTCTGAGTAANPILVGLPVAAGATGTYGSGWLLDVSTGLFYAGIAYPSSLSAAGLLIGNGAGLGNVAGVAGFTAALAAGDVISMNFSYEAAS